MSRRAIQFIVLVLLLTSCGGASQSTPLEADAQAEPVASITKEDMVGVWVGSQGKPYLRFTEDGRYCLALDRDELDTFPGDCGTYEVTEMVLALTSDQGYCKGELGSYDLMVTTLGQIQMKVFSDDCFEQRSNIGGMKFGPES